MLSTSKAALSAHLDALGVKPGMHLAVHSRLLSFGRIEGGAATVFEALIEAVGDGGTLVFPTYTLNLDATTPYTPATTPSHGMGALPEFARQQPGVSRTASPLHSHAVYGELSGRILQADASTSFGPRSCFDVMEKAGFHLLLLGCSLHEGGTFVHHVEAMTNIPYRQWIDIERQVVTGNSARPEKITVRYYARTPSADLANDLTRAQEAALSMPDTRRVRIGKRYSLLVPLASLHQTTQELLRDDPFALVTRRSAD